eukprot:COSAG01_NODE_43019_length_434_cov_0.540299_2_plen_58_part_01
MFCNERRPALREASEAAAESGHTWGQADNAAMAAKLAAEWKVMPLEEREGWAKKNNDA